MEWAALGLVCVIVFLVGHITGLLSTRKIKTGRWDNYPGNAGGILRERFPERFNDDGSMKDAPVPYSVAIGPSAADLEAAYLMNAHRKRMGCSHPADEPCFQRPKWSDDER